jgi:D-alanyl-D-alanine carboxypeptidase
MGWARNGARHWLNNHGLGNLRLGNLGLGNLGLRHSILSCAAIAAALAISSDAADARHHSRGHVHLAHRHSEYAPPTATIVVDGNAGAVLEESNPDAPRHPASLTKVMTLYLLFAQLEAGKIKLDTRLYVSEHAAEQAPTKLGLESGQTIVVEDAIKGIVTRSANDAAVAVAENLGGGERAFARIMTEKAHELGMTHTTYVNASGLPDDDQVTTARDQALLGRAIQDRFPRYYRFFSTTAFVFRGEVIRGHNHLIGAVAGVDGIKTGYTSASGFNLLTSVHHDGRYLVAVVLGGRSAAERDTHMRALIAANIELAAVGRAAPRLALRAASKGQPRREALARTFAPTRADSAATAPAPTGAAVGSNAPIRPVVVKTITYRTVTVPARPMAPVLVPAQSASTAEPAPARQAPTPSVDGSATVAASAERAPAVEPRPSRAELVRIVPGTDASAAEPDNITKPVSAAAPQAHSGWMIQIGAFEGEQAAREHLDAAKLKVPELASADPYTEPVQKGDTTLYRARFSGLDKETAEDDCRKLRRSDVPCMALKD